MQHALIIRAVLGGLGLATCVGFLSGVARAADGAGIPAPIAVGASLPSPIVVNAPGPQLFGMDTVPIRPAQYYDDWERARRDATRNPQIRRLIAPARDLLPDQQIFYVQAAVPRLIRWRSDATEWGAHDYWASADETLRHGYGDDDDRAIVKMQALLALGFSARNLYLTVGHDKVGGKVVVLIVRHRSRYYVLDDTGGAPFTTDRRPEFRPIMTFGYGGFWMHGRRVPAASARVTAAANATTANNAR